MEIIVSDDCSPEEETQRVVHEFMERDPRIQYFRQETNLGSHGNFRFVLEKLTGEYCLWTGDDEEWDDKFIEIGVQTLLENPHSDGWICTIKNIDGRGRVIREYPGFSRFGTTENKTKDIIRYLLEPEIMGKANIFHGIFRRDALNETIKEYWVNTRWGTDMCFNLAFITRFTLAATNEVLFYKRIIRPSDNDNQADPIRIQNPHRHIFPLKESIGYIYENYKAARNTPYRNLVVVIMILRLPIAIRNEWKNLFRMIISNRITRGIKRSLLYKLRKSPTPGSPG